MRTESDLTHRQQIEMGQQVGELAFTISRELQCQTCGIGKAIDVVGHRWGLVPYDWAGSVARDMVSPGSKGPVRHKCKNTTWDKPKPQEPDRRLPPERDEEDLF